MNEVHYPIHEYVREITLSENKLQRGIVMFVKTLREFYEAGYWEGVQLSYVREFDTKEQAQAFWDGYKDAKNGLGMSETKYW
jgi:hypothetical protein